MSEEQEISNSWEVCISSDPEIRSEEIIIRNTFFNSKLENLGSGVFPRKRSKGKKKKGEKRKKKIKWADEKFKKRGVVHSVFSQDDKINARHIRSASCSHSILKREAKNTP